ncbi:hypothetical protein VNO78_09792 [Psophocarpus tetragonolobus]|uniref:Cytochrome P450 n=1 Tax=Psophocarpus tetragonolobus TaxID=3891 RepID=A0AAN9SZQ8_PSOTE
MPCLLTLVTFFFILLLLLKSVRNLKKRESTPNIPPGPWKLPIIGNIHQVLASTPHQKLRDMAKIYGPLMHLQLGKMTTTIVSSPAYVKEIMKTHDVIFSSRPQSAVFDILYYESTGLASAPYGNYWRLLRKMCTIELFTQKRVNSFQQVRQEELVNLIKIIDSQKGSPVNLSQMVLSSIYSITSRVAFGKNYKGQEEFISLVKEEVEIAGRELYSSARWLQLVTGFRAKLERLHRQMDRILENIIIEHKEAKSRAKEVQSEQKDEDLVDILLKFQNINHGNKDICLTNDNIKAIIQDIFVGGGDTSAITIDWAMAEMVRDPRVMKKAQNEVRRVFNMTGNRVDETCINELKYLKSVVKETLRLHPPLPLVPRECRQACEIRGYHIPIKSSIVVNVWAIGRDPKFWSEAERFYPERFIDSSIDYKGANFEYIPFGTGRRMCPGITFGLINVEVALALLLYHFDWMLPNGMKNEDLDMTEQFGASVRRKDDLYLIPVTSSP